MSDEAALILRLEARTKKFERDLAKAIDKLDGNVKRGNRQFDKGMAQMERRAKRFTNNLTRTLSSVTGLGSIGIGASLAIGSRTIAEFRQSMSTVQAVTGATAQQFGLLEEKARALGATTRFSASEAANGMIELARAGFDTEEVLSSIEGTLLLAQSGAIELSEAAAITSGSVNGFRLAASDAGRVVDVLASAANSSATDVTELGQAMSFVAPVSATLGVSLEETAAAVSALSDNQIKGTRAGTGLRQVFIKLAAAGHDFSKEAGGVEGVLQRLAKENIGLTRATELVGDKQAASLLVLIESVGKIGELTTAYKDAGGTASRVAAIMDDNLNGALLATKSRLQELAIAFGEAGGEQALINLLEELMELLTFVAENADAFNKALIILSASAAGLIGGKALGGVIGVLGAARTSLLTTAATANVATLSFKNLSLGVKTLLVSLGPLGWVAIAAGAIAAFVTLGDSADNAKAKFDKYSKTMASVETANNSIKSDTKTLKTLHEELAQAVKDGGEAAIEAKTLEISAINERISKNKELLKLKRDLLKDQLAAGNDRTKALEQKQIKVATGAVSTRNTSDERAQQAIDQISARIDKKALEGIDLTKQEKKFRDLRIEVLEHNIALEEARERVQSLNDAIEGKTTSSSIPTVEPPVVSSSSSSTSDALSDAEKKKAAAELERELAAIALLGQTEREQIQDLLETRLSAINKSSKAEEEKNILRSKANADAKKEIAALEDAEAAASDAAKEKAEDLRRSNFSAFQDQLSALANIEAVKARMAGRAVEAANIELDATRERYEAELAYIDELIQKHGETDQLLADRANAQAGIAQTDQSQQDVNTRASEEFDALAGRDFESELQAELEFINEKEAAKLERLKELRTEELEALKNFEEQKRLIEEEADKERLEARFAAMRAQLNGTKDLLSGVTSAISAAGKENTKAAKIAAKAQQVISLGNAFINTAEGVTEALGSGNIPKAILVGAMGAIQIGVIASQTFEGGGYTGNGARAGGVDGKGGFYAILHPQETVIDHTKPGNMMTSAREGMSSLVPLRPTSSSSSQPPSVQSNVNYSPVNNYYGFTNEELMSSIQRSESKMRSEVPMIVQRSEDKNRRAGA